MSTDYKPGTVAMVTNDDEELLAFRVSYPADDWISADDGGLYDVKAVRPLVTLDPEDEEQVKRFVRACADDWCFEQDDECLRDVVEQMQAAFRSLIAPPRPPEPTGLGAVVEDSAGDIWVHDREPKPGYLGVEWLNVRTKAHRRYSDIDVVGAPLSEGVQP